MFLNISHLAKPTCKQKIGKVLIIHNKKSNWETFNITINEETPAANIVYKHGGQSAKNETNMNKINGSIKMNEYAENPATAHTHNR